MIFREETEDSPLLTRISSKIGEQFPDAGQFQAQAVFVATWDEVGYYMSQADMRNSFQLAIASNKSSSYALLLYASIQWIRSQGGKALQAEASAQAGFVSDDGRHQTLIVSGTEEMATIDEYVTRSTAIRRLSPAL